MRFIFNFIFFGFLFYLIYYFFPEAFHTMVSWAESVFVFIRDVSMRVWEKIRGSTETTGNAAWLLLLVAQVKGLANK